MFYKIVLASTALFATAQARAESAANIVVTNHSNITAACATITIDVATHSTLTHSWWVVANGASLSLGAGSFVYCEQEGNPNVTWGGSNGEPFCVNTPAIYVNPIYYSNREDECGRIGGQMRPFKQVQAPTGTYTWTLSP